MVSEKEKLRGGLAAFSTVSDRLEKLEIAIAELDRIPEQVDKLSDWLGELECRVKDLELWKLSHQKEIDEHDKMKLNALRGSQDMVKAFKEFQSAIFDPNRDDRSMTDSMELYKVKLMDMVTEAASVQEDLIREHREKRKDKTDTDKQDHKEEETGQDKEEETKS